MGPSFLHRIVSKGQTQVLDESPRANSQQARGGPLSPDGGSIVSAPLIDFVILMLAADQN